MVTIRTAMNTRGQRIGDQYMCTQCGRDALISSPLAIHNLFGIEQPDPFEAISKAIDEAF